MLSKKDQAIYKAINDEKIIDLFYSHVLIDNDNLDDDFDCDACYEDELYRTCHVWKSAENYGYGYFGVYDTITREVITVKAHRLSYAAEYGFDALPKGINGGDGQQMILNHICHNRLCVNPRHLESITHAHNLSSDKRKPRKPNDAIMADNLEDFMEQIRNTERE